MTAALAEAGGDPTQVVRTRMYITDAGHADEVGEAHGEVFGEIRPASTMVVVHGLLDPRWVVEMELEAVLTTPPLGSDKQEVDDVWKKEQRIARGERSAAGA